ncbi:MAG: M48 family metallopeptidase [Phycisphaerae bacterium]
MFLVVIVILSLVLAFTGPVYRWVTTPGLVVLAAAGAILVPALLAALTARRSLRLLEQHVTEPSHGQAALGRGSMFVQGALVIGHAALLLVTDWSTLCLQTPVVGDWPVVPAILTTIPLIVSLILVWAATYPADRAVRQIALEVYIMRGRPVRPVWSFGQYLVYNLRHQLLFVLIPMLLIVAARDVIYMYQQALRRFAGHDYFPDVLLGAAAVVVAVIAPEILRHVWATQRLPKGPLRDRLQSLCRRLGVRYREILVWKAGGVIVNAAVMGVVAPLRYILITDGMLEQLDDTRIEAVFGHEAGHVKRHHILYFLLFALISGCAVTIFSIQTRHLNENEAQYQVLAAALGVALLIKWGVVFGWISRRFERQADIFGVRTLAISGLPCTMPCALHHTLSDGPPPAGGDPLCATAAHVFGETLNEVAVLNGIAPERGSWRHGSISRRSRLVQRLARDPRATARSERTVRIVKVIIFIGALVGSAWAAWDLQLWKLIQAWSG